MNYAVEAAGRQSGAKSPPIDCRAPAYATPTPQCTVRGRARLHSPVILGCSICARRPPRAVYSIKLPHVPHNGVAIYGNTAVTGDFHLFIAGVFLPRRNLEWMFELLSGVT